ncbi:1-acyl-sn-glycerol-3-phosphate acyltransferase [Deinobacterium chartae]|uniref:1-acyl-sn-glycerol-3-phosphate acyltransferase n=1 Tax=Deinobacterium chartae TaxID=521158 RepID=A0A841HZI6_9DEIO|nr:lysophospholipid acyltransferase family protein [Deinobacterium chartae]MBB6098941.1 1-acyl-sn-glycerol-3-phosphate acyltransferase [Deinobacterium chartae]
MGGPLIYRFLRALAELVVRGFQGVKVEGLEHVPRSGRVVLAGNHITNFDPLVVGGVIRRQIRFMAKKELFGNAFMRWLMGSIGTFPVDRQSKRDISAVRQSIRVLEQEGALGIFPQGTRGGSEMMGGVALIALKGKAPIVPMRVARRGRGWLLRFGPPIAPEGTVAELTAKVEDAIERLA